MYIEIEIMHSCDYRIFDRVPCDRKKCNKLQQIGIRDADDCTDCFQRCIRRLLERVRGLEQQVEGYERNLISTVEEHDDLLQKLENDGILEVNDLKKIIDTIRRDNEYHDTRETALAAERRERLAQTEAQHIQTDVAILESEEKLQIALLEYQELISDLKDKKENGTAVAATLAFAIGRSEGTAATQEQNLDASADSELGMVGVR